MKSKSNLFVAGAIAAGLALSAAAAPANAQSVGYVTGIPGPDPAGGDELGWDRPTGPRPASTSPERCPPRARSRRGAITSAPAVRFIRRSAIYAPGAVAPGYGYGPPPRIVRRPAYHHRHAVKKQAHRRVVTRSRAY